MKFARGQTVFDYVCVQRPSIHGGFVLPFSRRRFCGNTTITRPGTRTLLPAPHTVRDSSRKHTQQYNTRVCAQSTCTSFATVLHSSLLSDVLRLWIQTHNARQYASHDATADSKPSRRAGRPIAVASGSTGKSMRRFRMRLNEIPPLQVPTRTLRYGRSVLLIRFFLLAFPDRLGTFERAPFVRLCMYFNHAVDGPSNVRFYRVFLLPRDLTLLLVFNIWKGNPVPEMDVYTRETHAPFCWIRVLTR